MLSNAIEVTNTLAAIDTVEETLKTDQINQERSAMTFVNEFASDEDIEKYDLNGIWDQYHPLRKGKYYLGQRPWFTIDRKRNIFFMVLSGGREEHSNRKETLLWIDGYHVLIVIDLAEGSSPNTNNLPFKRVWELVGIHPQRDFTQSREVIVKVLKEALTVYGYFGVHKQVPNTVVEFKF
ncbi:MAG: hypothetical protein KZQ88_11625 [Candidatus Thiodiazotropha sp. (ex Dulcina madagascariensis)]|nr:hypothetical protein [Candidatus Thiodiazotropha sp. (ex Dulcina madagascariensis)]MCU7926651.1 hypothetical protein [Candidatus Thiodiazotropha sp. (ex Dulcina madagascariensis)]